jgi:hypothetical protein
VPPTNRSTQTKRGTDEQKHMNETKCRQTGAEEQRETLTNKQENKNKKPTNQRAKAKCN